MLDAKKLKIPQYKDYDSLIEIKQSELNQIIEEEQLFLSLTQEKQLAIALFTQQGHECEEDSWDYEWNGSNPWEKEVHTRWLEKARVMIKDMGFESAMKAIKYM